MALALLYPPLFVRNFVPSRASFALAPPLRALVQALQERRARTMADRELARRVRDAIDRASSGAAHGLSFYVHEGTISVYGSVRDGAAREVLLGLAADQPGARRVIDHLVDSEV
jgi:hypothetical protein